MVNMCNAPGYCYSIAYWLACVSIIVNTRKRVKGWRLYIVQGFFLFILLSFMEFTNGVQPVLFIPCILVCCVLMLAQIYICCDFSILSAGYYCTRAFIMGEFMSSLAWQMYDYSVIYLNINTNELTRIIFLLTFYAVIYSIVFYVGKIKSNSSEAIEITKHQLVVVIIISIVVFFMANLSYVFQNTPFSSQFTREIFIIRTLVDLGGLTVLFAYHIQLKELQMKFEVDSLQNMLDMQYENYQKSLASIEMVNQKYHDLKHHIAVLKNDVCNEEKLEYLEKLEDEIRGYEAQNKTGNKVLDTILSSKSYYCQSNGITLTCVADGEKLDFIDTIDISVLFGNALDNAIESVKKISDTKKRLIHLSVSKKKNFLKIRVENYYEGNITLKNGLPITTKENKRFHGYGLKSITSIIRKYKGSVIIKAHNNWFELRILIPIESF